MDLLSLLFCVRAEIEANMPIYGSVFHEAILGPPHKLALYCSFVGHASGDFFALVLPIWEQVGESRGEDIWEERGITFSYSLLFGSFIFGVGKLSSPFLSVLNPNRWILCCRHNHVILKLDTH